MLQITYHVPFHRTLRFLFVSIVAGTLVPQIAPAQIVTPPKRQLAQSTDVVAKVDGTEIVREDVENLLHGGLKKKSGTAAVSSVPPALQAQALSQVIDRTLIESSLLRKGQHMSEAEVDTAVENLKKELTTRGQSWDLFVAERGLTEAALRRELRWEKTWNRYLNRNFGDEKVEAFFNAHHREFDGTELRISHILLRPARSGDSLGLVELTKQAEAIREKIAAGELTFTQAVEKHSSGPSRRDGGDLGFIPRHGRMLEEFTKAAFVLEKDQLSPPVVTTFGVHLIRWTEDRPGTKKWTDAAEDIKTIIAQEQFESLATEERKKAKVEFTGAMPYFKPGTREVAVP